MMYAIGAELGILSLWNLSLSFNINVPISLAIFHKHVCISLNIDLHSVANTHVHSLMASQSAIVSINNGAVE